MAISEQSPSQSKTHIEGVGMGGQPAASLGSSLKPGDLLNGEPAASHQILQSIASEILEKQYRLYSWNDFKTQALLTTNSILFAAIGFTYKECLKDTFAVCSLGIAVLVIGSSLCVCLIQVTRRIFSGKSGDGPNPRSVRGIVSYKNWEEYGKAFTTMTEKSILNDTLRQVYGMANNNIESINFIKRGVMLTFIGIAFLIVALMTSTFSAKNVHLLGKWQAESSVVEPKINQTVSTSSPSTNDLRSVDTTRSQLSKH